MSRVGLSKLKLPQNVAVTIEGTKVVVASKTNGNLKAEYAVSEGFTPTLEDGSISVVPTDMKTCNRALWGTHVRNIFSAVKGIEKPYEKKVDLVGVGYKAAIQGSKLVLDLGYSHKIEYDMPSDVQVKVGQKPTELLFSSASKQRLGQIVSEIKVYRKPEPYKGKGIIPEGTFVLRKEGKKK